MRRPGRLVLVFALGAMLAVPAAAQQPPVGVNWQHDVENAKVLAKQSGRLVLVHFWTPECIPCVQLERTVFSQPGVAGAIESQFVPVKLDANQNSGLAQGLGITRVPTDVILTPEGQIVGKLISPPTPSAYIAEVSQVAAQFATRRGGAYDNAIAAAPQPTLLNDAYASLQVAPGTPPAATTLPSGGSPIMSPGTQSLAPLPGLGGNVSTPPMQSLTPTSPGVPPASTPAVSYTAQAPAPDRYQTQFVNSEPLAVANPLGANAINNPNAMPPAPTQIGVPSAPTQPAPAVVPNQYALPAIGSSTPTPTTAPHAIPSPGAYPTPAVQPQAMPVTGGVSGAPNQSAPATAVMPAAASPAPPAGQHATAPVQAGATPSAQVPAASQASEPRVGFDGFCTVSMRNEWKWVEGNKKWGVNHRGLLYLFVGQKEQQQFLQNPDFYAPALSGIDAVLAIEHRQTVPGLRKHSVDYDNQIYLFSSEATLQQFTANPERYAASVRQAMGIERGQLVR